MSPSHENPNPLKLKMFTQGESVPDFEGGACTAQGLDPETWFQDDAMASRIAKSYCLMCPYGPSVWGRNDGDDSCYEYALEVEAETGYFAYGIFGGRDAAYRQAILDREKIADSLEPEDDEADH